METTIRFRVYVGVYGCHIGIMENMETTIGLRVLGLKG